MPEITIGQDYPTAYGQSTSSSEEMYDEVLVDRTFAGRLITRSLVPVANIKKVFKVVHPAILLADKQWLYNYYLVNRDASFNFLWKADNTVYTVMFTSQPKFDIVGGTWWKATVDLAEI